MNGQKNLEITGVLGKVTLLDKVSEVWFAPAVFT